MKILTEDQLDDYQQNKTCYEIFHTYHPINENEQMVYKKTNPTNEQINNDQKVVVPNQNPRTNQAAEPNNTKDIVATDRRPQNPQFKNRQYEQLEPNTVPNENRTVNHFSKVSDPVKTNSSDPTERQEVVHFIPNKATTPIKKRHIANTFQPTEFDNSTQPRNEVHKVNHFENQNSATNVEANNMLSKTINESNNLINGQDLQAEKYSEIKKAATQLEWVQKINSFELGYKKDLRNLPIPALRTFDLTDNQEMYLPLKDLSTLHDLNSFTITKDMCILLLFRNNAAIKMAPEAWFDNGKNRDILLKNKFQYFYKQVDSNALVETLKRISITSASTPEMTQFIIKHMPFVSAE
jgi:hypothetical protein